MKMFNHIAAAMMMLTLVMGAFNMPAVYTAHAQTTDDFSFDFPGFDFPDFDFGNNPSDTPAVDTVVPDTSVTEQSSDTQTSQGTSGDFDFPGFDFPDFDFDFDNGNLTTTSCNITAVDTTIFAGSSVTLNWETSGFDVIKINGQQMDAVNGAITLSNVLTNTTYTLTAATANAASTCTAAVTVICLPPPVDCRLQVNKTVDRSVAHVGDILTYIITVKNIGNSDCTGGVKIEDVVNNNLTYLTQSTSNNILAGYNGTPVFTTNDRTLHFDGVTLTPGEIGTITVTARVNTPNTCGDFEVVNQARATAHELGNFGDFVTSPVVHTAIDFDCNNTTPLPLCDSFVASPSNILVGGTSVLSWQTTNANRVVINNGVGDVAVDGSVTVSPLTTTTYLLTAIGADNHQVTCAIPVSVGTTNVFTCANNVSFTASDSSIRRGDDTVLTWNTVNVDTVSISDIGATTLSGSRSVEPRNDTTYVLTATRGAQSVSCPLSINVSSGGGGGGGSKTPRCELSISDNSIRAGEQVTLKWDSKNATDLKIKDDHGKTIVDTDDVSSSKKKDLFDGTERVRPTRDTEYTLTVERGSKDRVCKVKVNVDDIKVITDRQPTVAGISLSNVPYTGFEAGPILTILFYILLVAWALFVTYLIVVRRKTALSSTGSMIAGFPVNSFTAMREAEAIRPDLFPAKVIPSVAAPAMAPSNLPTVQSDPGQGTELATPVNPHQVDGGIVTELENRAHAQMALLSSDALRHFITTTEGSLERHEALDTVIAEAKAQYPLEDGWIVINEARMQNLCEKCMDKQTPSEAEPFVPAVLPEGSSSLAEAIVTGNIVAAYEMIGNRPMFSLADAAADLDAVVRHRRGETTHMSDLLASETAKLSDEKLKNMIAALTGALDGTYTDEASAVKMAIMKAVKEAA